MTNPMNSGKSLFDALSLSISFSFTFIVKLNNKIYSLMSTLLIIPFYLVWILGYLNAISLGLYLILEKIFSVTFIIGLTIALGPIIYKITKLIHKDGYFLVVILIMTIFMALGSSLSYIKYLTYNAYAWDLGIFEQALFSVAFYHRLFYYTVELYVNPSGSFLGTHYSPILFSLVPIYYLSPHVLTLLVLQAILLYIPVIPLYIMSMHLTHDRSIAFITSLMYLISPGIASPLYYDFHVEVFIPLLYITTVLLILMRRWVLAISLMVLFLMIIEYTPIIALTMIIPIIYILIKNRELGKHVMHITLLVAMIILYMIITPKVMGILNPYKSSLAVYNPSTIAGYSGNPINFMQYAIKYWVFVKQEILTNIQQKIMYYAILGAPLFPSLLSPLWLLPAVPYTAFSFLSTYPAYYMLDLQYTMYVIPQLFVAYIMSIKHTKQYIKHVLITSLIIGIILFALYNPLSPAASQNLYVFIKYLSSTRVKALNLLVRLIPNNASVLTIDSVFPHLANRINAYVFPMSMPNYNEYVLNINATYILMTIDSRGSEAGLLKAEVQGYGMLAAVNGTYLFKKGYDGEPIMYDPLTNYVIPASEFLLWPGTHAKTFNKIQGAIYYWPEDYSGTFWIGPFYLTLLPGTYNVTAYFTVTKPCNGTIGILQASNIAGSQIYASTPILCSYFKEPNEWTGVALTLIVNSTSEDPIMLRCINMTGITGVYFSGVVINQIS